MINEKDNLLENEYRAVCYSGFREGQHPDRGEGSVNPSEEEILEDLRIITGYCGFKLIRLYDSGENSHSVLKIIENNNLDVKVLLGIWLKAEKSNHETCHWMKEPISERELAANADENKKEIERGIDLANRHKKIVAAINVGNESLVDWNDHGVPVEKVITYVKKVQGDVSQPVTVAENFHWWLEKGRGLAETVDFISIHTYAAWSGFDIDEAMDVTISETSKVIDAFPRKQIVITEAGWASEASEFGSRASEAKQSRYCNELFSWAEKANITVFVFEAFDEPWKGNPDNPEGAEKHWGLFYVDRQPKEVMRR